MQLRQAGVQCLCVVALATVLCSVAEAENWPNWRGPKNDGISAETGLPTTWDSEKNVAWKLKLPGSGGATPVVWGDRVFLTAVVGDELTLICVGTDGKTQWSQVVSKGNKDVRGDEGNSAANSPSTDGKHVWTMFANGAVACFTVDGKKVWSLDLPDRYGAFKIAFGLTSTPVLDDGRLYLQLIHGEQNDKPSEGLVVCLDAATGNQLWMQKRHTDGVFENKSSYASPMMYDHGGLKYFVTHGADYVIAHDLLDGHEIWRCGNLNVKANYDKTLRFVASPLCADGMIVVPTAKRGPVRVLRPDGKGDITNSIEAHLWSHARTPDVPSPLIHDGLVYLCMADGNLACLDQKTGEEYYFERTQRQRHRASPVYADGHLYLTARDGVISVVKAGKTFEMVAQNELGEAIAASPAISNGTIYLRTFDSLWAVRK
ncbi:MAG: PQQ-binding-like beta-propeller repeat protein [Planctomycetota bacterium]|nr:PQQ-binding-like beta-propeller repeat protein [Planctomycetota bacterium]